MSTQVIVSSEFQAIVRDTILLARQLPDDAISYMANTIPVYLLPDATREMALAGGCEFCTYLGLWADQWPGYPISQHGTIWLFESGIRTMGPDVKANAYEVLTHEMGHALQRDHVLDALEAAQARGQNYAPALTQGARGCGCPGRPV